MKPHPEIEQASGIDTSRLPEAQRAVMELTETARESVAMEKTFAGGLFFGRYDTEKIHPWPAQTIEDRDQGDAFLHRLAAVLRETVDPDQIDEDGEIPEAVVDALARIGAFGIKIPARYGGLGLSQTNYCRAAMLLGSYCGNLTALLSAHQSIGVPQPLLMFGTEEQRRKYLPRTAAGEISAFALTEPGAGSDPARMTTRAEPSPDGSEFILNGRKMWCTNGTRAGVIVVMAKTPPKTDGGKMQITAFIVEASWPGVEIVQRCHFMGLRALYNAVIDFHDVRVPRENILFAEGKGLRVALATLNTGRLTLPAACTGLAKRCLEISTRWAVSREQWGRAIGCHAFIADKIAAMAAETFAMESMTMLTASLADKGKQDFRLESAMCKLRATEWSWRMVNDTMQIRGGRGYEKASSLRTRGESPDAVERMLRDSRINTIFEGSSEIMRLFIAREAIDPHLKVAGPVMDSRLPFARRAGAAMHSAAFYTRWYSGTCVPGKSGAGKFHRMLRRHVRWCSGTARQLSRTLFHLLVHHGPAVEKRQLTLGRAVDIGVEIFAMSATLSRAQSMQDRGEPDAARALELADYFCNAARLRVAEWFRAMRQNADAQGYRLAQKIAKDMPASLSEGIL